MAYNVLFILGEIIILFFEPLEHHNNKGFMNYDEHDSEAEVS